MTHDPLVTVVLPSYRMGPYIEEALDSVAAQSYAKWEAIVVDDHAPEDGTHAIVQRFAERMTKHRVELIRHERNQGVSGARNTGIAAAQGMFIAFLDPDDLWKSEHLARCMDQFRQSEDLDVCTGPVEIFKDHEEATVKVSALGAWHRLYFPSTLGINNFIQPSASVVRKASLDAVDGFDTEPELQHIEDYDLWIRLVERGGRFAFLPEPTTRYRQHGGAATANMERMRALRVRLEQRHQDFFRRANAIMVRVIFETQLRMERELVDLRVRYNGPVMRTILALDAFLRKLFGARKPPSI